MRIGLDVHVLTGHAQGTATVWRSLIPHLPAEHEYVLYSFDEAVTRAMFPEPRFVHRRLPIRQAHLRIQLVYPYLARRDGCDVFHANYYGPLLGAPGLVLTFHDVLYLDFPAFAPAARRLQFALLGCASAHAAKALIADSHYAGRRLVHHFGVSPDKVTVVYPGLDAAWLVPDEDAIAAAWSRVGRPLPARYLLGVGRLDPRKNVVLTARIARQLRDEGLTDGLVWVGPEDFGAAEIRRQLERERLLDVVHRVSDLAPDELRAVVRHAQALVFLSLAEGFGYPPVEAMAMGTPAVVSNRTSVPEVCADAALVVDPDDERAACDAARAVIADASLRATLRERGRGRLSLFTGDEMARRTMEVYRRAADA